MTVKKFETGRTYSTRSICDHDRVFSFRVVGRTEKTITIDYLGKISRRKIRVWNNAEQIDPFGRYSMAPVLSATD